MKLLVVHERILRDWDLAWEIREPVMGILEQPATLSDDVEVLFSDCRRVWRMHAIDGRLRGEPAGSLTALLAKGRSAVDVAHVHSPEPPVHLIAASALRSRGIPVVFTPHTMLGRDFATQSWFVDRPVPIYPKPQIVAGLRAAWKRVAVRFICLSAEEMRQGDFPEDRSALLPWPAPYTPLVERLRAQRPAPGHDSGGPVAVCTRAAVYQKGLDRMAQWLLECSELPDRPRAILLAPGGDTGEPLLDAAVSSKGLTIDGQTMGADLLPVLQGCRGAMLLSRWDGQPRALREGALMGLPTISTPNCHFAEVVEVLGQGRIVSGDDPSEIQDGYSDIADQGKDPETAWALFDRGRIGRMLADLLLEVANGAPLSFRSYYEEFQDQAEDALRAPGVEGDIRGEVSQ